jgi:hypothetical protein
LIHFFFVDVDAEDVLSESVLWKSSVIDAGSVTAGLILLYLEVEASAVSPDVKAVILDIAANTVWRSSVVFASVSRLVLSASARGASSVFAL